MVSAPPPVSLDRDRQPSASPQRIYNFYSPPQNGASRSTVLVHGPQRCLVCQQTGGRRRFMHCLDGGCGEHFQAGCKTSGVRQPKTSFELLIGCNVKCCVTQGTRPGLESNLLNCSHGTTASLHKRSRTKGSSQTRHILVFNGEKVCYRDFDVFFKSFIHVYVPHTSSPLHAPANSSTTHLFTGRTASVIQVTTSSLNNTI